MGLPDRTSGQSLVPIWFFVRSDTGLHPVLSSIVKIKQKLLEKVAPVPDINQWRLGFLSKLLSQRGEAYYRADDDEVARVTSLIDSLCVN